MQLFIPYFDAAHFAETLNEAREYVQCGDRVTVMAPVLVPGSLPVNAPAGPIWKQVCRAEQQLFHARQAVRRLIPDGVDVRYVRVQARDRATAILTGALHYRADCLLLPTWAGARGFMTTRFGTIHAVLRSAPCAVRFVETRDQGAASTPLTQLEALTALHVIATNPEVAPSPTRQSGAHHVS